jgi:hypothetical protein
MSLKLRAVVAAGLLAATPAATFAQAAKPWANADVEAGRALARKTCDGCHAAKSGGDSLGFYTRANRKVRTPAQLLAQVQLCNSELKLELFPDDELDAAAHLDRDVYRFP